MVYKFSGCTKIDCRQKFSGLQKFCKNGKRKFCSSPIFRCRLMYIMQNQMNHCVHKASLRAPSPPMSTVRNCSPLALGGGGGVRRNYWAALARDLAKICAHMVSSDVWIRVNFAHFSVENLVKSGSGRNTNSHQDSKINFDSLDIKDFSTQGKKSISLFTEFLGKIPSLY